MCRWSTRLKVSARSMRPSAVPLDGDRRRAEVAREAAGDRVADRERARPGMNVRALITRVAAAGRLEGPGESAKSPLDKPARRFVVPAQKVASVGLYGPADRRTDGALDPRGLHRPAIAAAPRCCCRVGRPPRSTRSVESSSVVSRLQARMNVEASKGERAMRGLRVGAGDEAVRSRSSGRRPDDEEKASDRGGARHGEAR